MKRVQPWWIAAAGAVVVASVVGVGAVMAQEPTPSPSGTPEGTPTAQSTPGAQGTPDAGATPESAVPGANTEKARGGCGRIVDRAALASFLGITEEQLQTELQVEGATLATVAEAHGQSRDALKGFLTDQAQTRLDEKVATGDLTQEQADARLAEFTANLDAVIDGALPAGRGFHGKPESPENGPDGSNGSSGSFSRDANRS